MSIHLALSIHTLKIHLQTWLVFRFDRFILHFYISIDFHGDITDDFAMTTENHIFRIVLGLYNLCLLYIITRTERTTMSTLIVMRAGSPCRCVLCVQCPSTHHWSNFILRPFLPPVFDHLQHSNTKREGLTKSPRLPPSIFEYCKAINYWRWELPRNEAPPSYYLVASICPV